MSLMNFIPELWSAKIQMNAQKNLVYAGVCNTDYESDLAYGNRIKISSIGAITVSDYVPGTSSLTYAPLQASSLWLDVNQQKEFDFAVDDIHKVQANADLIGAATTDAAYRIKDAVDTYIAGKYTDAGVKTSLGTDAAPLTVTSADTSGSNTGILEFLGLVNEKLTMNNCPSDGRWIVVPPWMATKIIKANISITSVSTQETATVAGYVAKILGLTVLVSNNVQYGSGGSSTTKSKILAGINQSISVAMQINSVETLRLQSRFETGVRGLCVFGAKVVRPDYLACATASYAAG